MNEKKETSKRQELGLLDFQSKNMMTLPRKVRNGSLDDWLKQAGILYVKGGTRTNGRYQPENRLLLDESKLYSDNYSKSSDSNEAESKEFQCEMCKCQHCTKGHNTPYYSNYAVQVATNLSPHQYDDYNLDHKKQWDNWRQIGLKVVSNEVKEKESQRRTIYESIDCNNYKIAEENYYPGETIEPEKNAFANQSIQNLLPSMSKPISPQLSNQYPWIEKANRLSSNTTSKPDENIPHAKRISPKSSNMDDIMRHPTGLRGIGCLSPVKVKNPRDLTKILGAPIDKGNRVGGWINSTNIRTPTDIASVSLAMMPNVSRSYNVMGNDIAKLNQNRFQNHVLQQNLKPQISWNLNNSTRNNFNHSINRFDRQNIIYRNDGIIYRNNITEHGRSQYEPTNDNEEHNIRNPNRDLFY